MTKPAQPNQYLKYSGMVFQLFVLLAVGAWLGQYLDEKLNTPDPYFTILLILLFTAGFFYKLVKDLSQNNDT